MIVLEADRPEWEWPGGEILWHHFASLPAVAAETGTYVLWNPLGSGLLQIVEFALVSAVGNVGAYFWTRIDPGTVPAAFDATSFGMSRDARAFQRGVTTFPSPIGATLFRGSLTAAEVAAYLTSGSARQNRPWTSYGLESWIIPEGYGLGFQTATANLASEFALWGRQHTQERGIPS